MVDVVDPATRSRMMSGIRSKNTKPEILVRKALFAKGWRYRLHDRKLPGKPDIVFTRLKSVIFINGCFWHGHTCKDFRLPTTRTEFWREKISRNQERDLRSRKALDAIGYRSLTVWECALRGPNQLDFGKLIDRVEGWLRSQVGSLAIEGKNNVSATSD